MLRQSPRALRKELFCFKQRIRGVQASQAPKRFAARRNWEARSSNTEYPDIAVYCLLADSSRAVLILISMLVRSGSLGVSRTSCLYSVHAPFGSITWFRPCGCDLLDDVGRFGRTVVGEELGGGRSSARSTGVGLGLRGSGRRVDTYRLSAFGSDFLGGSSGFFDPPAAKIVLSRSRGIKLKHSFQGVIKLFLKKTRRPVRRPITTRVGPGSTVDYKHTVRSDPSTIDVVRRTLRCPPYRAPLVGT